MAGARCKTKGSTSFWLECWPRYVNSHQAMLWDAKLNRTRDRRDKFPPTRLSPLSKSSSIRFLGFIFRSERA